MATPNAPIVEERNEHPSSVEGEPPMFFRRIRTTAQIFSSAHSAEQAEPDVVFLEETPESISRISAAIGGLIEVGVVVIGSSILANFLIQRFVGTTNATVTGIGTAILSLLGWNAFHDLNREIQLRLKIGERLAPFFGHKIEETYRALKG